MKKNTEKTENLITQAEAARKADVSKTAIGKIKKSGAYNFFVEDGKKTKIDIDHPHWKAYLQERNIKSSKSVEKKPVEKKSVKSGSRVSKKKSTSKSKSKAKGSTKDKISNEDKLLKKESIKQKNSLTGGYDPSNMIPTTPSQLKALTDIQEKNINMRIRLNELIEVEMLISIIESLSRDIKNFVMLGRSVSNTICQKLDRVGMEKVVEEIINKPVERNIITIKKNMAKSIDIESYKE